jgi:hypothetical protein
LATEMAPGTRPTAVMATATAVATVTNHHTATTQHWITAQEAWVQ